MADTEVQIGDRIIGENTKVTVTIKTLAWAIGGVITLFSTLFTMAYFDLKSELESTKDMLQKEKDKYIEVVNQKLTSRDVEYLREIGDIKGNIKVLLDRTSIYRTGNTSNDGFNNKQPNSQDGFQNNVPKD